MLRIERSLVGINIKELIREKYMHGLVILSILLLVLSSLLGMLSFDEKRRILFHLGIFSIQICTFISALMFGSMVLSRDIQQQTFQIILARPVSRFQFILAKILSSFFLLLLIPVILGFFLYLLLGFDLSFIGFFQNILGIILESWILFTFAFFISTFSRPSLSFILAGVFYLAGHWRDDLNYFAKKSKDSSWLALSNAADYAIPPLNALDLKSIQFVDQNIWSDQFLLAAGITLLWITVLIFGSYLSWRERDLV